MNSNQKTIQLGVLLAFVTLVLFFGLFIVFSTQGKMSEAQYFNYSALANCFLMPIVYAGFGFYNVYTSAKVQPLTFSQAWKKTFLPMFIGGLLSLGAIFIFFNTSGSWAEDSLQRGWLDLILANPNPEFMEKNGEIVQGMEDLSNNMFSGRVFLLSFSTILFFYFLISTIFAIFIKNRRI